jgi:hypothetical protein
MVEIRHAEVSFAEVFVVCSFSSLYALLFLLLSSQELQKKEALSGAAGSRPVLPAATSDPKAPLLAAIMEGAREDAPTEANKDKELTPAPAADDEKVDRSARDLSTLEVERLGLG